MARRKDHSLIKVTFNVKVDDWELLERFYPQIGKTVAARRILNNFCNALRQREGEAHDKFTINQTTKL